MDHIRISGIEPSSMILSQRKKLQKLKNNTPKVPKEEKSQRRVPITYTHDLISTQNYCSNKIIIILINSYKSLKVVSCFCKSWRSTFLIYKENFFPNSSRTLYEKQREWIWTYQCPVSNWKRGNFYMFNSMSHDGSLYTHKKNRLIFFFFCNLWSVNRLTSTDAIFS